MSKTVIATDLPSNRGEASPPALSDEVLLAFSPLEGGGKPVSLSFSEATRNILVLGGTGSGKTSGVVLPCLARLLEAGCVGLIIDPKRELGVLREHYADQVATIGITSEAVPINLIAGLSTENLRAWLLWGLRTCQGSDANSYWGRSAVEDAVLVYLAEQAMGQSPTLASLVEALLFPDQFVERFRTWLEQRKSLPEELATQLNMRRSDSFSMLAIGGFGQPGRRPVSPDVAQQQYTWHVNMLLLFLQSFYSNPLIRSKLCAEDSELTIQAAFEAGVSCLVDLPILDAGVTGPMIGLLLKQQLVNAILRRKDTAGWGENRFSFLVADEAHFFLNLGSAPGLMNDSEWLGISRAYGHINLICSSGLSGLHARYEGQPHAVASLIQHCSHRLIFALGDNETLVELTRQIGFGVFESLRTQLSLNAPRGQAVAFIAGEVPRAIRTGAVFGHPHMARFLGKGTPLPAPTPPVESKLVSNPFKSAAASAAETKDDVR